MIHHRYLPRGITYMPSVHLPQLLNHFSFHPLLAKKVPILQVLNVSTNCPLIFVVYVVCPYLKLDLKNFFLWIIKLCIIFCNSHYKLCPYLSYYAYLFKLPLLHIMSLFKMMPYYVIISHIIMQLFIKINCNAHSMIYFSCDMSCITLKFIEFNTFSLPI